ncbi:MAG TPA: hypothetical protein PKY59_24055 [Pyrinomonadaceae bacterium]|nr:hypothetical protein [Pyrinomonadaceae bacterium]
MSVKIVFLSLFFLLGACHIFEGSFAEKKVDAIRCYKKNELFPFISDENRSKRILENWRKVQKGMSPEEVVDILGDPDCITSAIFPSGKVDGWYWEYSIYRKYPRSINDDDKVISIQINQKEKVGFLFQYNIDDSAQVVVF